MLRHNLMMSVPNICFAYDATDAADRKILKDAVDAAIRELNTEHEQDIQGLKAKNTELIDKLKTVRLMHKRWRDLRRNLRKLKIN